MLDPDKEIRSSQLSNAKAMANGFVAMQATLCALLAAQGVTGPMMVIEGRRGLNRGLLAGADLNLLMERAHIRTDAALNQYTPGSYPAAVELTQENGEQRTAEVFCPKGHPRNPMSRAEVEAKFLGCARGVLSEQRQGRIVSLVENLDKLATISDLMNELAIGREAN